LAAVTSYTVTISAVSGSGATGTASSGSGTTLSLLPGAPTGLSTSGITYSTITVNWAASSGATSYNVYVTGGQTATYNVTTTSKSLTGLVAGTSFTFTVKSVSSTAGENPTGGTITGSTTAPIVYTYFNQTSATSLYATIPSGVNRLTIYVTSNASSSAGIWRSKYQSWSVSFGSMTSVLVNLWTNTSPNYSGYVTYTISGQAAVQVPSTSGLLQTGTFVTTYAASGYAQLTWS
jgi:hypothetical protein